MLVSPCRLLFLSHLIYEINDSLKHLSGVRRGEFYPLRSQRSTLGCYSTLSNNLCPETLKLDLPNVKGDEGNRWSLFRCERYIAYTFHLHLSSILDLCLHQIIDHGLQTIRDSTEYFGMARWEPNPFMPIHHWIHMSRILTCMFGAEAQSIRIAYSPL